MQPYHKYVFDESNRTFVGKFEEMYLNEDIDNFDSWFQEDMTTLEKQFSLLILNKYNFSSILDIGCGKGTFTHLLKKKNNSVKGIDLSETAIKKAKAKYPEIEFYAMSLESAILQKYDLVVMMQVLSYIEDWKNVIQKLSKMTKYAYISLYLPPDPIGYIKTFDSLKVAILKYFKVEIEVLANGNNILLLCKSNLQ